jgi:hypothetical protein
LKQQRSKLLLLQKEEGSSTMATNIEKITARWISFCAASFAILVIASTFISMKPEGTK